MSNPDDKPTRLIPVWPRKTAIIDEEDYERVKRWHWVWLGSGYVTARIYDGWNVRISLHQFLMLPPPGMEVDHIDGNPLNNRRSNLRICTSAQNNFNSRKQKRNTSGFKGVTWHKSAKKWQAAIGFNGKVKFLGYFSDSISAARAYDKAARKLFGKFAKPNFPTGA